MNSIITFLYMFGAVIAGVAISAGGEVVLGWSIAAGAFLV
jgi:hypothetical protein